MFTLSFIAIALSLVSGACADTPEVTFSPADIYNATIAQVYSTITPIYYDSLKPTVGAQLYVNQQSATQPVTSSLGTPFSFIPVASTYMGYTQTNTTIFGHVALTSNTTLHLAVTSAGGSIPRLAVANKLDDVSQLEQFWSLEISTRVLKFLGSRYSAETFAPVGFEPILPTQSRELVVLTPIYNTTGRFVFQRSVIAPCPPLPSSTLVTKRQVACPL